MNNSTPKEDCEICGKPHKEFDFDKMKKSAKAAAEVMFESTPSEGRISCVTCQCREHPITEICNECGHKTPSEGWIERFDDMFFNRTDWKIQDMRDFISQEIATAKHQERQEIIKEIFEKVVLSEDQARVIKSLEER